ncbi:MAG: aldo/keto reductase, partial [Pirellulales bacterium]
EPDAGRRRAVIQRAVDAGINWFDTATGYGNGLSERCLAEALSQISWPHELHVATKVRLQSDQLDNVAEAMEASVDASLKRLGVESVTLLQLHNAITQQRGDEPFSLSAEDVLKRGGVADALAQIKRSEKARLVGLTGLGHAKALVEVIRNFRDASGTSLDTVQTPYHMLNPTAAGNLVGFKSDVDYGGFTLECRFNGVGVFAIRVFAGGALLGNPPSAHTHTTPFFPLTLYERDTQRALQLRAYLAERGWKGDPLTTALRFVLPGAICDSAILGFASPEQVDQAVRPECFEPLPEDVREAVFDFAELQYLEECRRRLGINTNDHSN